MFKTRKLRMHCSKEIVSVRVLTRINDLFDELEVRLSCRSFGIDLKRIGVDHQSKPVGLDLEMSLTQELQLEAPAAGCGGGNALFAPELEVLVDRISDLMIGISFPELSDDRIDHKRKG